MKKYVFAALAMLCAIACHEMELSPEREIAPDELYASMEAMGPTKTTMDRNNNVLWSEGDRLVAFMKTTLGLKYQIKEQYIGSNSGSFSKVDEPINGDDLESGYEMDHNVVVYPYAAGTWCMKNDSNTPAKSYELNINLPETQEYAKDSFGNGAFPMIAVSEDNRLTFRNICGGIKLRITGEDKVKSIILEGLGNELLSGKASVIGYADGSAPSITMEQSASCRVTLDCGEGVQLDSDTPTIFIIAVPPVEFKSGMKITITDTNGFDKTLTNTSANTIRRSTLSNFPVISYKPEILPTNPDEFALIDLGLSVKWANYNMGAESPYGLGTPSTWGHEEGQDVSYPDDMNISGSGYDLVRKSLGGTWRLPTAFDFMELEQKCTWRHVVINETPGNLITGPNGNSIFLPDISYWTGTARERSTDDHDYIYGIEWKPESSVIASGKYNRPVQGEVRLYPEVTYATEDIGKNSATIAVSLENPDAYNFDLGVKLKLSHDSSYTVDYSGHQGGKYIFNVDGLSSGTYYYIKASYDLLGYKVEDDNNGRITITTLAATDGDGREAEPVDLGLSVKWASWNLGASCSNDKGFELAWGGISVKDETYNNYKEEISGTSHDPATALWGPEWRLPTLEEWREVVNYDYRDYYIHATHGVLLQNKLFLPGNGVTNYMSGSYGKGCYFLIDAYCYSGSLLSTQKAYVRPVYDPLPQLAEVSISDNLSTSVSLRSSIIRIGGAEITEKGFVYGKDQSPELGTASSIIADGAEFEATISGLAANSTYYVRPYARNSYGTSYGKEVSFSTED